MAKSRLRLLFEETIRPKMLKELELNNIMQVPQIQKIVVNIGAKEAVNDTRILNKYSDILANITGQKPVRTLAKKSIAGFKIREGMPLGVKVTLRGDRMYDFLDKFISLALPKVKDFQGLKRRFDNGGNYNIGLKESSVFPEAERSNKEEAVTGMNITIQTTARSGDDAYILLKNLGIPFKKTKS